MKLNRIDIRKDRTIIRYGKTDLELPVGKAGLREWIKARVDAIPDEDQIALCLSEHLKGGGTLDDVSKLAGKNVDIGVTVKDSN